MEVGRQCHFQLRNIYDWSGLNIELHIRTRVLVS